MTSSPFSETEKVSEALTTAIVREINHHSEYLADESPIPLQRFPIKRKRTRQEYIK